MVPVAEIVAVVVGGAVDAFDVVDGGDGAGCVASDGVGAESGMVPVDFVVGAAAVVGGADEELDVVEGLVPADSAVDEHAAMVSADATTSTSLRPLRPVLWVTSSPSEWEMPDPVRSRKVRRACHRAVTADCGNILRR